MNHLAVAVEAIRRGVPIRDALTQAAIDCEPAIDAPEVMPAGSHYWDDVDGHREHAFPMYSMALREQLNAGSSHG